MVLLILREWEHGRYDGVDEPCNLAHSPCEKLFELLDSVGHGSGSISFRTVRVVRSGELWEATRYDLHLTTSYQLSKLPKPAILAFLPTCSSIP